MLHIDFGILFRLFDTIDAHFHSFRCWDRTSSDGDLHVSLGGNDKRGSLNIVLHERWRARPRPLSVGAFKSLSGWSALKNISVLI